MSVDGIRKRRDKFMEYYETYSRDDKNKSESNSDSDDSDMSAKEKGTHGGGEKKGVFDESLKDGLVVSIDPNKREEQEGKPIYF